MKKLLLTLFACLTHLIYSQTVPPGINYQAVIRNNTGAIATNSVISLKFELYNTGTATSFTYAEIHTALPTGSVGVVTCKIGMGTALTGYFFNNVNWAGGDVWYQVYLDLGSGFTPIGTKQNFMTVPYAFYAAKSSAPTLALTGNVLSTVGGNSVTIPSSGASTSTITGQGLAIVTPTSGSLFNVSVPTPSLSYSANTLSIKQGTFTSNTVTIAPTLSLNTTTGVLYSGITTNSVNLLSIPSSTLWTRIGNDIHSTLLGNVSIGATNFGYKFKVIENANVAGSAIYGLSSSTNSLSAGIHGINTGAGNSIYGHKTSGTSGSAGYFKKDIATFPDPALYAETNGAGAAVYAKSSNPNNPLALEVNGHVKSSGASPTATIILENIYNYSGSTVTTSMNTTYTNTDVSGNVKVNFPTALTATNASGTSANYSFVVVRVTFNKSYSNIPKIILTPVVVNYLQIFDFSITNQTTSGFEVLINYSFGSASSVSSVSFNYLAIE